MRALQRVMEMDSAMTAELNRERASGLGRTGRLLEEALAACEALGQRLAAEPKGPRRSELLSDYAAQLKQAHEQRWYLEVQREAMGLRRHTDLDTFFPLPRPITE